MEKSKTPQKLILTDIQIIYSTSNIGPGNARTVGRATEVIDTR
jgi:hypothetical protein